MTWNVEPVREFIRAKGPRLLDALGEKAGETPWTFHSHGAVLLVAGPRDDLFERLVAVILRRPEDPTGDEFRSWAEQRLARLNRYLEATNTGRVVRTLALENCVAGVVMRRVGLDPTDRRAELPDPEAVPGLLAAFALDVERYVKFMGDEGLRYVGAVRLHLIPKGERRPRWLLGLDVLDTAVGLRGPPLDLPPLALIRGLTAELANRVAIADPFQGLSTPILPWRWLGRSHAKRRRVAVVRGLETVVEQFDATRPPLAVAARWLTRVRAPWLTLPVGGAIAIVLLGAGAVVWAVLRARAG